MRRTLLAIATCGALGWMLVGAASAMAGSFTIASCKADRLNYSTDAFVEFSERGMQKLRRECNPRGTGLRGMVTASPVRAGSVPRGAVSRATMTAPPGTVFSKLTWGGRPWRTDCRFALRVYAARPDKTMVPMLNVRANQNCPRKGMRAQSAHLVKTEDVSGATEIVQQITCEGGGGRKSCSTRGANFINTYEVLVDVVDVQPPTAAISADTPLGVGAWVGGGDQPLKYTAQDNVGVRDAKAVIGTDTVGTEDRPCTMATPEAFAVTVPCPNGIGQIMVDTRNLQDGTHPLVVQAQDAARNLGDSAPGVARIDNNAPPPVQAAVDGGEQWRNRNDFAVSWVNQPENDRAPIVAATAKLCPAAGGDCRQTDHSGADIASLPVQLPGPGEWKLSVWRRDAAGNQDAKLASVPVTLRYDPEPPRLGFEPSPPSDPTAISVDVTDPISGLADGSIEISPAGSGTWHTLATQKAANRLTARIDDAAMPAGDYLLRATARDQARNEASTTQRLDGQQMAVTLPLRIATAMQAGIEGKRTVRRVVRLRGKRRTIRRRVNVLRPTAGVRFGRAVRVAGRLTNRDGEGIAGADVQVLSRSDAAAEQVVGVAKTDAAGRYTYAAAGSTSRVLRFAYAGSSITLPAQSEVRLRVPATSTLNVNRPRLFNGQSARFSGRVRTLPVPVDGKLVELQVQLSGRWQTFRTGRTDAAGRWRLSYGFARTRSDQRFRFRVKLPREAGYPYAQGGSRAIQVLVRGR